VPRAAPCLLGLYSVVALLFAGLPEQDRRGSVQWPGKAVLTFSDALTAVRRWLWSSWVFPQAAGGGRPTTPRPAASARALGPRAWRL